MNINYLKMQKMPTFDDWSGVLEVLRKGDFFTTTGEILIHDFSATKTGASTAFESKFPLAFAELIWGDANAVHRKRLEYHDGEADGFRLADWTLDLKDATWARLEIWDIARNGAFTQPITPQGIRPKD
jgi:hypothetical protein